LTNFNHVDRGRLETSHAVRIQGDPMKLFLASLSLLVSLAPIVACGDDPKTASDADATNDTTSDTANDTTPDVAPDSADDTTPDGAGDASPDTTDTTDATDAVLDATDGETDASEDVSIDATADAAPETIDVAPEVSATPHIVLRGPNGPISGSDDAGEHEAGVAFVRTYTITNSGTAPLTVSGVTFPKAGVPTNCEQTLTDAPDEVIAVDATTTFTIAATLPDEGEANCPFIVGSDDPDMSALTVDVAASGIAAPQTIKYAATATCGINSGFGILVGVLADFSADGTLVTTDTPVANCIVTTQVGILPGGTTVNHGADSATCGNLSCTENNNLCSGFGGAPFTAGGAVTVTMTDVLLGGPVTHTFPVAPGVLNRAAIGASKSRSAPLTFTTSGGVAGTLTLVTIHQDNPDGQTTAICEFPAESASVTVPTSILGLFHDGAFDLLVDTRVQAFSVANGYDVALVVVNSSLPQQSSFTP